MPAKAPGVRSLPFAPTAQTDPTETFPYFEETNLAAKGARKKANPTLCWSCRYATGKPLDAPCECEHSASAESQCQISVPQNRASKPKFCPWIEHFEYVKGWDVVEGPSLDQFDKNQKSVHVVSCPLYKSDLAQQIKELSAEDLAIYLGFSPTYVNRYLFTMRRLLFACIQSYKRYAEELEGTTAKNSLERSTKRADELHLTHKNLQNLAEFLEEKLPPKSAPIDEKIRDQALKELILYTQIDTEMMPDLTDVPSVPVLLMTLKRIKKERKRRAAAQEAQNSQENQQI